MYDDFLVVRCCSKLSAKFLLGTSAAIEKVGLLSYFWFLARTTIRIALNFQEYSNSSEHLILVRVRETLLLWNSRRSVFAWMIDNCSLTLIKGCYNFYLVVSETIELKNSSLNKNTQEIQLRIFTREVFLNKPTTYMYLVELGSEANIRKR